MDIVDIQHALGHSNIAMTLHYVGEKTTVTDTGKMATILI